MAVSENRASPPRQARIEVSQPTPAVTRGCLMKDLSRRQRSILDFIEGFLTDNDYPPTIRDIQRELDISSTSVVDYNLKVLEERNYIRRNRNISRGIEVIGRAGRRTNTVQIPVIGQIAA